MRVSSKTKAAQRRKEEAELRELALAVCYSLLDAPREVTIPPRIMHFILERALPVLEREKRAAAGRPGADGAGEMVQAFINMGMGQVEARKMVQERTGLKYRSVVAHHHRFLKTGKQALLYARATLTRLP